jgi:hypothetical protein
LTWPGSSIGGATLTNTVYPPESAMDPANERGRELLLAMATRSFSARSISVRATD